MKRGFYLKLAWSGIRKNRRLYTPYLLTCVGMVMMFYVVSFLSECPVLEEMRGGMTLQSMLSFGSWVIGAFALIFLFYTNSFLIRRRKKEFGLYNIFGNGEGESGSYPFMGKPYRRWDCADCRLVFWRSSFQACGTGNGQSGKRRHYVFAFFRP